MAKLRGVTFTWKKDGTPSAGVIAQELEAVMPEAVSTKDDGIKTVNYNILVAPLIEEVKELKTQNEEMRAATAKEIMALRAEFTAYKTQHP